MGVSPIKKMVFYIPAILVTMLFAWLTVAAFGAIHPIVAGWLLLLWLSGALLDKNLSWGGVLGMIPAIHWIYMSAQDTGQVIGIERPLGIATLLFYAACMCWVYQKKAIQRSK